jgi:hypothetical protein
MSLIHHRHSGGNYPHVHRHDGADESTHHHDESTHHHQEHNDEDHRSLGHGDHAYDAHGNEAAIVASDPHRLEHWHFDRPFAGVAIAPVRDLATDFDTTVVAVANHDLNYLPLAARPPPALI